MTKFCYWDAPGQSCVIVSGTPTKAGDFPVKIKSKGRGTILGLGTWGSAPDNDKYTLHVNSSSSGIESAGNTASFSVQQNIPNPFTEKTEINFSSENSSDVELKVYNMLGAVVYSNKLKSSKGNNKVVLYGDSFTPGVYMYSVRNGNTVITKRMVVE